MANVLHSCILFILFLFTFTISDAGISVPEITDQDFIKGCVDEHNRARSSVSPSANNMRYMTWDNGLAVLARSWGRKCRFYHNPGRTHPVFSSVGENLWVGTAGLLSPFNLQSAIQAWVNEVKDYNYNTQACSAVCGHYTQVVWAETYKLGCAVVYCPNGIERTDYRSGGVFVCNYAPAGNYAGVRPYKQGSSCSECVREACVDHLCRNSTRDGAIYGDSAECGVSCKTVLIIRPVALLLIFGSVYVVQWRCPNIFAYIN